MKKTVFIQGREITYDFLRKKIKNINMRIHRDGKICVSAPFGVSLEFVEKFIISRSDWIIKHMERLNNVSPCNVELVGGEHISFLGKEYVLSFNECNQKSCCIIEDKLIISLPNIDDKEMGKKILSNFLNDKLTETINVMSTQIYENHFKDLGVPSPEINIRKMKARWGTCYSQKHKIIFNKALVFLPLDCVEYIVFHEFTHFLHPDHSKAFYNTLNSFLPDFKDRKYRLNKYVGIEKSFF